MKVAVVGAGLAGLSAAWWLGRAGHAVTLFERQPGPGFTAASVALPGAGADGPHRVDVPLRVFYPGYYPTLTALYRALAVPTEPVSYASSLVDAQGQLFFRYRNLRWGGRSFGWLAPQDLLLGARARRILAGLLRFNREAVRARRASLRDGPPHGPQRGLSVGDFVAQRGFDADFVDGFLLPAIATVCTCSYAQARQFPLAVIVDYLDSGLPRQAVHRALHGADDVQRRLLAGIPDLRCNARITGISHQPAGGPAPLPASVYLRFDDGSVLAFDHVVLATQANQALALLQGGHEAHPANDAHGASLDERSVLAAFRYSPVPVLTHTDPGLMPARRRDWSPVNLRVVAGASAPESTIWVNAVQPALRAAPDLFQTVHPLTEPRAARVIARACFERPVVDAGSEQALLRLARLHDQPGRRLWFCGAYAQAGIPLLESAVRSAWVVAQRLGVGATPIGVKLK